MFFFKNKSGNIKDCDFVVIDLETSGLDVNNCEIIEVGAIKVMNGEVIDKFSSLIKPNFPVDDKALLINRISPIDLKKAPSKNKVIPKFLRFIGNNTIVGYNIKTFDLPILYRYANDYDHLLSNNSNDILDLARVKLPFLSNRKLSTVASYLQIETDNAHRAINDCLITLKVYFGLVDLPDAPKEKKVKKFRIKNSKETNTLNKLSAVIKGILVDNKIDEYELVFLRKWLTQHQELKGHYPYDRIFSVLSDILDDEIAEQHEIDFLLQLLKDFNDGKITTSINEVIDIENKVFVLTGEFAQGERSSIIRRLESIGGINRNSISGKTDFLIVGSLGSADWTSEHYGTKIKKAKELQNQGKNILIVSEVDFFQNLK